MRGSGQTSTDTLRIKIVRVRASVARSLTGRGSRAGATDTPFPRADPPSTCPGERHEFGGGALFDDLAGIDYELPRLI